MSISQIQRFHNVILPETLHFLPRIEVTLPPDFRCFSCIGILESFLIVAVLCQSATGVRPCMSAVICHLNLNETHGSCDVTFSSSICTHPTPLPLPDLAARVQNSRNSTLFTHSNVQFHLTFAISAPRPSSPPSHTSFSPLKIHQISTFSFNMFPTFSSIQLLDSSTPQTRPLSRFTLLFPFQAMADTFVIDSTRSDDYCLFCSYILRKFTMIFSVGSK